MTWTHFFAVPCHHHAGQTPIKQTSKVKTQDTNQFQVMASSRSSRHRGAAAELPPLDEPERYMKAQRAAARVFSSAAPNVSTANAEHTLPSSVSEFIIKDNPLAEGEELIVDCPNQVSMTAVTIDSLDSTPPPSPRLSLPSSPPLPSSLAPPSYASIAQGASQAGGTAESPIPTTDLPHTNSALAAAQLPPTAVVPPLHSAPPSAVLQP